MSCLFCEIIAGNIPCERVFENEQFIVIKDIAPIAPIHLLILPKEHMSDCAELAKQGDLAAKVFEVAEKVVSTFEMTNGYRLVTNKGSDGGQSVAHLHFHLLGGKQLNWPNL